ncbi:hypothetical protein MMC18_003554 [Xylographa bjoerkii]|nr:hypothetical protein [Xylographa bjoerkii]
MDLDINDRGTLNAGRIPYKSSMIVFGVLYGTAAIAVSLRIITRIYTLHRLYLDDVFLVFGFLCLTTATGISLHFAKLVYLTEAYDMGLMVDVSYTSFIALTYLTVLLDSFLILVWTSNFCVKFSFLALFHMLIRRVSAALTIYYWVVVGACIISWMFLCSEIFIVCPYFGVESLECSANGSDSSLFAGFAIFMSLADIATDIMIVSIPLLLFHKTQLKTSQKLSLSLFLCLSLVMALAALTRVSGYRLNGIVDVTWQVIWKWTEACVASIMGSLVAFRALFSHGGTRASVKKEKAYPDSMRQHLTRQTNRAKAAEWEELDYDSLPKIPEARLSELRTYIGTSQWRNSSNTMSEPGLTYWEDKGRAASPASENFICIDEEMTISGKAFWEE